MTTLKEILASTVYGNAGDDMELFHKIDAFIENPATSVEDAACAEVFANKMMGQTVSLREAIQYIKEQRAVPGWADGREEREAFRNLALGKRKANRK